MKRSPYFLRAACNPASLFFSVPANSNCSKPFCLPPPPPSQPPPHTLLLPPSPSNASLLGPSLTDWHGPPQPPHPIWCASMDSPRISASMTGTRRWWVRPPTSMQPQPQAPRTTNPGTFSATCSDILLSSTSHGSHTRRSCQIRSAVVWCWCDQQVPALTRSPWEGRRANRALGCREDRRWVEEERSRATLGDQPTPPPAPGRRL